MMAESSPGIHDNRRGSSAVTDGSLSSSQPSSLPVTEDHFSHAVAETSEQFTNG